MLVALLGTLAVALYGAPAAWGCAFPLQGCKPEVCAKHKLSDFNALLDDRSFFANASGIGSNFDRVPQTLGYYFSAYNKNYNGGEYDSSKKAFRDGAPSLNYFELRSTLGTFVRGGVKLKWCCNKCRTTPGCSLWLFNPYVNEDVAPPVFYDTGDCNFLLQSSNGKEWTYDKVNDHCTENTYNEITATDDSVKPYFYGGKCDREVLDEPHFVGAHGTRFDFGGQLDKSFCMLTDTNLQINALLRGYMAPGAGEKGMRSWMKELGILWLGEEGQKHTLRLVARTGREQERGNGFLALVELDGKPMEVPSQTGAALARGVMSLTFEGAGRAGKYDVDNFQVRVGSLLDLNLALRVAHPKFQRPDDAEVHFNLVFDGLKVSEQVHGVLGQTYRKTESQELKAVKYSALTQILGAPVQADGRTGKGFLDGDVQDYETTSLLTTDCKFSSFGA